MRCSSVQRRLTSEARRLSTHFAFFPERSLRRALGCGRLSAVGGAASLSESSLVAFTVHVYLSSSDKLLGRGCSAEMWVQRDYRAISGDDPGDCRVTGQVRSGEPTRAW